MAESNSENLGKLGLQHLSDGSCVRTLQETNNNIGYIINNNNF